MADIRYKQIVASDLMNWFEAFLIDRRSTRLSRKTVEFYKYGLSKFLKYCTLNGIQNVEDITATIIRKYLLSLEDEGYTPGGIHCKWRAIRCFFNWYEIENIQEGWRSPIRNIKVKSPRIEPLEPADIVAVKAILRTCSQKLGDSHWQSRYQVLNVRDKAIILMLLDTGLRASELLALTLDNINPITGVIQVVHGKGGKSRTVYIGRKTRQHLRRYLKLIDKKIENGQIFINHKEQPLTVNGLNQMLAERAKIAGVKKQSPHAFRRLFALTMLRNGVDIYSLQLLMGHADLQVLKRYLKLTQTDTLEAHIRGGPVDKLM